MNDELVIKAQRALEEGRLDEGDSSMLEMVLEQYSKYPESKRIENTIRELIKRTRKVITISEEDMEIIESDASRLMAILEDYHGLSVPTKKNRNFVSIRNALINAFKENNKVQ